MNWLISLLLALSLSASANAAVIQVNEGESIQAAIDGSVEGDLINVAAGTYREDINFNGKNVRVSGVGNKTHIRGTGNGPVITFNSGEKFTATLDQVRITNGSATNGGGIFIENSSPTITRCTIRNNRAENQGSAVYISGTGIDDDSADLFNNLIFRNRAVQEENFVEPPHAIEILNASPGILNNTIFKNRGNGIAARGSVSNPIIKNNVIASNGARIGERVGRGICLLSGSTANIEYNLFHRNRKSAILIQGEDFDRIVEAQAELNLESLANNLDGNPKFRNRKRPNVRLRNSSPARDAGDPNNPDIDESQNDIGVEGGPFPHPNYRKGVNTTI